MYGILLAPGKYPFSWRWNQGQVGNYFRLMRTADYCVVTIFLFVVGTSLYTHITGHDLPTRSLLCKCIATSTTSLSCSHWTKQMYLLEWIMSLFCDQWFCPTLLYKKESVMALIWTYTTVHIWVWFYLNNG